MRLVEVLGISIIIENEQIVFDSRIFDHNQEGEEVWTEDVDPDHDFRNYLQIEWRIHSERFKVCWFVVVLVVWWFDFLVVRLLVDCNRGLIIVVM